MFDSMLEFMSQAASNSVFVFCFCNLIIAVILVGSKSSPNIDKEDDQEFPVSVIINTSTNQKQVRKSEQLFDELSINANELSYFLQAEAEAVADKEEKGNNSDQDNKDGEDDDDDDELRRRVEEFIEKVNKGWKEELLGPRV